MGFVLKYMCWFLIAVQCLTSAIEVPLRDIVQIKNYRIKCSNATRELLAAKKISRNKVIEKTRAFRYINIGGIRPSLQQQHSNEVEKSPVVIKNKKTWKCIKCPSLRVLLPNKYNDGVTVELPQLMSCSGHKVGTNYEIETFFSPSNQLYLPEGSHNFIGRIKNLETNEIEKVCNIKFKIKVRRCQKFMNMDKNLRIFCDSGNVWGSKCKFSCKNSTILSHNQPMYCSDDLQWLGILPYCHKIQPNLNESRPFNPIQDCTLPRPEPSSEFLCDTPLGSWAMRRDDLLVPEGTTCKLHCQKMNEQSVVKQNENYFCWNGRWNGTFAC